MKTPLILRQERDFGQKINATFSFAVQHFRPLGACLLYLVAPVALLAGVVSGIYQSRLLPFMAAQPSSNDPMQALRRVFSPEYALIILFSGLSSVLLSLTVAAYLAEYEAAGYAAPSVATVGQRLRQHLLSGIGLALAVFFTVLLGTVLLVIPGIYAGVALSLSFMVLVSGTSRYFAGF